MADESRYETRIKVPLALDSELEIPLGGVISVPLRSLFSALIACVPAGIVFFSPILSFEIRSIVAIVILMAAIVLSIPKTQGVWIGTFLIYRVMKGFIYNGSKNGEGRRVKGEWLDATTLSFGASKEENQWGLRMPYLKHASHMPKLTNVENGFFVTDTGGYRAVLALEGPTVALGGRAYDQWSQEVLAWVNAMDCPVQVFSLVEHHNAQRAREAFEQRVRKGWGMSPVLINERNLIEELAQNSLALTTYIVLAADSTRVDGIPFQSSFLDWNKVYPTSQVVAQEKMATALRTVKSFERITVRVAQKEEIEKLLAYSPLGARQTIATERAVKIDNEYGSTYHIPLIVTKMARSLSPGDIVDAVMRARCQAEVSVVCNPVSSRVARNKVIKVRQMRTYASSKKGAGDIGDALTIQDTEMVEQALAEGEPAFTVAISINVFAEHIEEAEEGALRLLAHLEQGKRFGVYHITQPGLLPLMASCLGGAPLRRSCILTLALVAQRCLPALGTPFGDVRGALVGINQFTGSPAYLDIWRQGKNHNMLIVAQSGSGKSVAMKSLLWRHAIAGTNCVIVDPDNEYRQLIKLLQGEYYELGTDSLNVMAVAETYTPEQAAAQVGAVLSVLAGEVHVNEKGGIVRRMATEDKYWMQQRLLEFFRRFEVKVREPVLRDFVSYLEEWVLSARNESEEDRGRKLQERLAFYTQGRLAEFFDRPSTFTLGKRPVGIGLRKLANEYSSDLTPAMAMVLTAVFAVIQKVNQRFLVVVDEAHHLTSDPDAGQVLQNIVRRGRKSALGVWMATQQVEDFISTPLGRTLTNSSAVKLVMGVDAEMVGEMKEVFRLRDEEASSLFPVHAGRGVLLTDSGERGVVQILVGGNLMHQIDTRPAVVRDAG